MKMFFLLTCTALFSTSSLLMAATSPASTKTDNEQYMSLLKNELQKQQLRISTLTDQIQKKQVIFDDNLRNQLENAIIVLDVKNTLYSKFNNAPSLQSSVVRQQLLNIFQQESITAADLASLQNTVDQEKAKLNLAP